MIHLSQTLAHLHVHLIKSV